MNDYFDYLQHSGVKGQKWGERRWQNEDGSLTPEGYEHYGYGQGRDRNNSGNQDYNRQNYNKPRDTYNHKMSTINTRSAKEIMAIGNKQYGLNKTKDFAKRHGESTFKKLVTTAAIAAFIVSGFKSVNTYTTTRTTIAKVNGKKQVTTVKLSRRY